MIIVSRDIPPTMQAPEFRGQPGTANWRIRSQIRAGPAYLRHDGGRRASRPCTFQKVSIAALCSLADALVRIGEYVADNGMMCNGPYQAARDLLMLATPSRDPGWLLR